VWDETHDVIESMIGRWGLWKVVIAPYILLAPLGGYGVISKTPVLFTGALALTFFDLLAIIVSLGVQLRRRRAELADRARTLTWYVDKFVRAPDHLAFHIDDWFEDTTVGKNGDAFIERWITLIVGEHELFSCWTATYPSTGARLSNSMRRKVKVEARAFAMTNSGRELGAHYDVTYEWEEDKQRAFIHFGQTRAPGETVRLWVRWRWPQYYRALLEGATEPFEWIMHRPAGKLRAEITFSKAARVKNPPRVTPFTGCPRPELRDSSDGATVVTFEQVNLPANTPVGFTLDTARVR
jgi:hypothetical protein